MLIKVITPLWARCLFKLRHDGSLGMHVLVVLFIHVIAARDQCVFDTLAFNDFNILSNSIGSSEIPGIVIPEGLDVRYDGDLDQQQFRRTI